MNAKRFSLHRSAIIHGVIVALLYFIVAYLALIVEVKAMGMATVWPSSGMLLAALVLSRRHHWPFILGAVFLSNALANLIGGNSLGVSFGFALANCLEAVGAAWLLVRFIGTPITFTTVRQVIGLVVLAVIGSNAVTALLGAAIPHLAFGASFWEAWRAWWVADGLGMLLVGGTILAWAPTRRDKIFVNRRQRIEAVVVMGLITLLSRYIFGASPNPEITLEPYLVFPLLIWAALRCGMRGATAAALLLAIVAVVYTSLGRGPFVAIHPDSITQIREVQIFLLVAGLTTLVLAASMGERRQAQVALQEANDTLEQRVLIRTQELSATNARLQAEIAERVRTEQALRESEERFRLLVAGVKDYAIFMLDPTGHVISWNVGAERIHGYQEHEIIGQHFSRFYLPAEQHGNKPAQELEYALVNGQHAEEGLRVRKDGTTFWAHVVMTPVYDVAGNLRGFAKVTRDITERKQAEDERNRLYEAEQQARTSAQEAVRVRDAFLSVASHELKNPLTVVLGQAHLLQRRATQEGRFSERDLRALTMISDQAQRLNALITALLDISRIESGQLTIEREPLDLCAVTRRVVAAVQPSLTQHTLVCIIPDTPLMVEGDTLRLEQVFTNLVGNAIKYSPYGGEITVQVTQQENCIAVAIRDQGIGIPQEALPHLFQRFYRAPNAVGHRVTGTGIGLYVVKELVTLHGGTITVASSEGEGSTFTIHLPRATVTAPALEQS